LAAAALTLAAVESRDDILKGIPGAAAIVVPRRKITMMGLDFSLG